MHLCDLEELLESIYDPEMRVFMKEALGCYSVGAYRGTIVLSCMAMCDDLARKIKKISTFNKQARDLHKNVEKKRNDLEVFESYLLDQLASNNLISKLDSSILQQIRDKRNKAAHPSGHSPTAEEARYIFRTVVDLVLSRKGLDDKHPADLILNRIDHDLFFPLKNIEKVNEVVADELAAVSDTAYEYLVAKLTSYFTDQKKIRNAELFMLGMLCFSETAELAVYKFIKPRVSDPNLGDFTIRVFSARPKLLNLADSTTRDRFIALLENSCSQLYQNTLYIDRPYEFFKSYIEEVEPVSTNSELLRIATTYIKERIYEEEVLSLAIIDPKLRGIFISELIQNAGAWNFHIANRAVRYLTQNTEIHKYFEVTESLLLFKEILKSAGYGATASKEIVAKSFTDLEVMRHRVDRYFRENQQETKYDEIKEKIVSSS